MSMSNPSDHMCDQSRRVSGARRWSASREGSDGRERDLRAGDDGELRGSAARRGAEPAVHVAPIRRRKGSLTV